MEYFVITLFIRKHEILATNWYTFNWNHNYKETIICSKDNETYFTRNEYLDRIKVI
jgi:hypothetical protein